MTLDPTLEPDDGPLRADDGLDRLGRLSLVDQSMRSLLDQVVRLAQRCLPRQPEASLTLMRGLRPHTAAFSGDLAMDLDESQEDTGTDPASRRRPAVRWSRSSTPGPTAGGAAVSRQRSSAVA
jgi:hypothetical protein